MYEKMVQMAQLCAEWLGTDPTDKDIDFCVPDMLARADHKAVRGFLSGAAWDIAVAAVFSLCAGKSMSEVYQIVSAKPLYLRCFDLEETADEFWQSKTVSRIIVPVLYSFIYAETDKDHTDPQKIFLGHATAEVVGNERDVKIKMMSMAISAAMAKVSDKPDNNNFDPIKKEFCEIMQYDEDKTAEFNLLAKWNNDNLVNTYDQIFACIYAVMIEANRGDIDIADWHNFILLVRDCMPAMKDVGETETSLISMGVLGKDNDINVDAMCMGYGVDLSDYD